MFDECLEEYAELLFKLEDKPISDKIVNEILNLDVPSGSIKKWDFQENLNSSRKLMRDVKNSNEVASIFRSINIKVMELLKLKYYAYIQQHPEKYGEVDPDKFSTQVESYFSQSLLDKVSQEAEEERKPNTEKSAG